MKKKYIALKLEYFQIHLVIIKFSFFADLGFILKINNYSFWFCTGYLHINTMENL